VPPFLLFILIQGVVPLFGLNLVQFIWNFSQRVAAERAGPLWTAPEPQSWLYVAVLWSWQAAVALYPTAPGSAAWCVVLALFSLFLLVGALDHKRRHDNVARNTPWKPTLGLRWLVSFLVIVAGSAFALSNFEGPIIRQAPPPRRYTDDSSPVTPGRYASPEKWSLPAPPFVRTKDG
jgi:hypothetical protein